MLVIFSPEGVLLSEQLGSLRCAVGIARALGAKLLLPSCWCGSWIALEEAIDAATLASLVPLVTESRAQEWCVFSSMRCRILPHRAIARQVPGGRERLCPLHAPRCASCQSREL